MLEFYSAHGVISPPAMVGMFTGLLMNSFHVNIMKPLAENIAPSHKLDNKCITDDKGNFINNGTIYNIELHQERCKFKWQTFLRDLFLWLITLFIFYIVFKFILKMDIPKPPTNN